MSQILNMTQKYFLLLLVALLFFSACQQQSAATQEEKVEPTITDYERIISLSGAITETLFALGHGDKVIGIDVTSTYPPEEVSQRTQLGHVRNLNVEGVLSLEPDLILVDKKDAGNPAIQQLRQSEIAVLVVPVNYTLEAPVEIATTIAAKLGGHAEVQALQEKVESAKAQLSAITADRKNPKVLFIYARGAGSMMVAGKNTSADAMIQLAGGVNAVTEFEGFKALSAEALILAQPDVLLLFESGLQSVGGMEKLLEMPGIEQTTAGKHQQVIAMDGLYLLGFTPRVGEAAIELAEELQAIAEKQTDNS